jgi:integrase
MARQTAALTDTAIKKAKAKDKDYKLFDGNGLFLLVAKTDNKRWRLKYRFNGKEKLLALGLYPNITLREARELREHYRNIIAKGIDPSEQRKKEKEVIKKDNIKQENTFLKVSQEWLKNYESEVSENYHKKLERALELYVYPFIKSKAIDEVTRLDIIAILEYLRDKELLETANRTLMILNKIFMYAVTYEYIPHNIIADIDKKVILGKIVKKNYPTFTKDKDIKALLLSIDDYQGDYTTKKALQMLPYVFVRSFNIRHCEWSEIDLKAKIWVIPSNKMKTKTEFILPLPHQVIKILKEVKEFSGSGKYVFPSFRAKDKPMSDNTLISAIRRMGYTKDEFVPHGFRAMFSTIAYEKANNKDGHNYTGEVIEALLAHKEPNKVKGAYNRAKYIEPMRGLICWYANYLDGVKNAIN